jgi:tetratricopeptide (TPR) repeat protein
VSKLPVILFVSLLVWVNSGRAQSEASAANEPASYREAVDRAIEEFGLGNFEEAREQFAKAHQIYPNARALRGLGMSEFELRNYVEAADYLERALASRTRALEDKSRRETERLLERTRGYVGELELELSPLSASVLVDGAPRAIGEGALLRLDVGSHSLELQADGYIAVKRDVTVRGGKTETLTIKLAKIGESAANGGTTNVDRSETTPAYKRWWVWTIVGVVVAGAAAGAAVALTYKKPRPDYVTAPTPNTPAGVGIAPLLRY